MKGLIGKNALVTGGSSGIGQAIAIRLAEEGVNVAIHYNTGLDGARETQRRIEQGKSDVKLTLVHADLAEEDAINGMFEAVFTELDGLDILINNAGYQVCGDSHSIDSEDFTRVVATNLTGSFLCAQHSIRHFLSARRPRGDRQRIERA